MEQTSLELCPSTDADRAEEPPKKSKGKKKAAEQVEDDAWCLENYLDRHEELHYTKLKVDTKQEQGQVCKSLPADPWPLLIALDCAFESGIIK